MCTQIKQCLLSGAITGEEFVSEANFLGWIQNDLMLTLKVQTSIKSQDPEKHTQRLSLGSKEKDKYGTLFQNAECKF